MQFRKTSFCSYVPDPTIERLIEDISVEDVEKRRAPTKHYAYVVYVAWSNGNVSVVHRTYRDFQRLHSQLQERFNKDAGLSAQGKVIPELQGRVILRRDNVQKVALWRLQLLDEYCKVLSSLPPIISSTPGVVRFFQPTDLDVKTTCKNRRMSSKRKGSKVASEISTPLPSERYVAIADYVKTTKDELTIAEGESLEVFIRDESGWWLVCKDQTYGWVPYSYLEKVDGRVEEPVTIIPNGMAERYMAVDNYIPMQCDEAGLDKGQVVEVLEKHLDGWWKVRYANQEGMVPAISLAKADSKKARRALEKAQILPKPENDLNPDLELFEQKDSDDTDSESDKESDFIDTFDIMEMRERVASMTSSEANGEFHKGQLGLKKRMIRPPPRRGSVKSNGNLDRQAQHEGQPEITEEDDHSHKKLRKGSTSSNESTSDGEDADPSRSRETDVLYENIVVGDPVETHEDESDKHDYYNVSPFNRKQSKKDRPVYESRSAFKAGDAGETDLIEGERVTVLEKTGTGWWLVQSAVGVGWVPSHFLKLPKGQISTAPPTSPDVPGDTYEATAAQKYLPKLPASSAEVKKVDQGHVAFRYLQNTHSGQMGAEKPQGSPGGEQGAGQKIQSNRTPSPRVKCKTITPPPLGKPTNKAKPTAQNFIPTETSSSAKSSPVNSLNKSLFANFSKTSPSASTHSQSSSVSGTGSASGVSASSRSPKTDSKKPAVPPKKPSSVVGSKTMDNEAKSGDNKASETPAAQKSVKDLKAMFNKA